jgi:hypothetical protein
MCGAADAKLACSLCRQARYCDSQCSKKHWCEGGGMGGSVRHEYINIGLVESKILLR